MKAATRCSFLPPVLLRISIHAAREGGDDGEGGTVTEWTISIHAAREGGDDGNAVRRVFEFGFQSTPPVKAATSCP